jgi:hypothetical protein
MHPGTRNVVLSYPTEFADPTKQSKPAKWENAMNRDSVEEIFAMRRLYYFDETNEKRTVSVFVGKPQPSPDSPGYECSFQVIGIGGQQTQKACGQDSIQALQSALILAAASLNHLNDQLGRKLVWDGGINGELGFP